MRIEVKVFALTIALFAGVAFFMIAWWGILLGHEGESIPGLFGHLYLGYDYTLKGSLLGFLWGFVDCGLGAIIFAWLYNKIADKLGS